MTAHEFNCEASVLIGVLLNPEILEEVECTLVRVVLGMIREETVANEGIGPEARDTFNDLPAPFIHRLQSGLSLTFWGINQAYQYISHCFKIKTHREQAQRAQDRVGSPPTFSTLPHRPPNL